MEEVSTIQNGINHKPFNPNSDRHQQFLEGLKNKIARLQEEHSFINFFSKKEQDNN